MLDSQPFNIQSTLDITDWDRISSLCKISEFTHAEIFLKEGVTNNNIYFVLDGNAQALIDEGNGIIHRIGAGEFIGEVSFLERQKTIVPVLAECGAKIACIDGNTLRKICASDLGPVIK